MKETAKIIDVACGGKMFWFDKNNPDVVFCDKREEEHTRHCLDIKAESSQKPIGYVL